MNSDEQQFETEFVTPNKLSKLLGMPRNQVMKDIHSGRLHAFKRGKSYYVYSTDARKYIFDLICEARGQKPGDYDFLLGLDGYQLVQAFVKEGAKINDKSKN